MTSIYKFRIALFLHFYLNSKIELRQAGLGLLYRLLTQLGLSIYEGMMIMMPRAAIAGVLMMIAHHEALARFYFSAPKGHLEALGGLPSFFH